VIRCGEIHEREKARAHVCQERQLGVGTAPALGEQAHLREHGGWDQERTRVSGQKIPAALMVIVAVVEQGDDRPGIDDDHPSKRSGSTSPLRSVRRMASERSARSGSAVNVPALANRRGDVGTGSCTLSRSIRSIASRRASGTAWTIRLRVESILCDLSPC
jgi:hypothetical protein